MKKIHKLLMVSILFILIFFQNIRVYADDFSIDANSGIIVETNTGKIIYNKDAEEQNFPASVTKVLTAIVVIENCDLNEKAVATASAVSNIPSGYVVAPLFVGEEMRIEDLLYALMLKSSNDAAYVLAEHVGGSVDAFSEMMNKKAQEIGCKNTHFVNPNGIHNDNHYTTAYDMYLISNYAMKNETFAKIVSTYKYTLPATNKYKQADRVMENTNSFLNPNSIYYNEIVKGVKTGTTTQAGNCLITDSDKDGLNFITVILGAKTSESKFSETKRMIEYAYDNYTLTKLHNKNDVITNIEIDKATKETKNLDLLISDEIIVMNNKSITVDQMTPIIKIKDDIIAPVNAGDEIGTISYNIDGLEYNAKLVAANNVEKKTYYIEISIAAGIGIIIIIIIFGITKSKKNKKI